MSSNSNHVAEQGKSSMLRNDATATNNAPQAIHEQQQYIQRTETAFSLSRIIASPRPVAVTGFVMSLTPLSCNLMGWRGSVNSGAAEIGAYFFFGGILMLVGGIFELILNNAFTSIVFLSFGGFWLFFGATLQPFFAASAEYGGSEAPGFSSALSFLFLFMGVLCFFFMICSLRLNIAFVFLFFTVTIGLALVSATLWLAAEDRPEAAKACAKAAGGILFACAMGGWYLLVAMMLQTVDFPIQLPLGDLSGRIPGYSQRMSRATQKAGERESAEKA